MEYLGKRVVHLGLKVDRVDPCQPGDHLQHPHQRVAESFELAPWALQVMGFDSVQAPTKTCILFDDLYSCCSFMCGCTN
jgi:hypothetical protein